MNELTRITPQHVQAFASSLEDSDNLAARQAGYRNALDALISMHARSSASWALVKNGEVLGVMGVFRAPPVSELWVHTGEAFKTAGLGALRLVRDRFAQLRREYTELTLEIDSQNHALVRLADWLGFVHRGFIERHGRPFHRAVLRGAHVFS